VSRYVLSRPPGQSSETLRSVLSSLRAVCSYAEACGYLGAGRISPFRIKRLSKWVTRTERKEGRHLSRDEIRRVLDRLRLDVAERTEWAQWRSRRIYVLTAIIAYCALRKNEAIRLQVGDVDLPGRTIHIVARTKLKTTASAQPVPIPDALVPILADWLAHRLDAPPGVVVPACPWLIPCINRKVPWLHGALGAKSLDVFQDAAERAGIQGATLQALRRSWATHAEYHGLGPAMIQRVLRHTSGRTAERWYRKADLPNMREVCKGIDF
jgi:integrase